MQTMPERLHVMWASWMQGVQSTITLNGATLAVFTGSLFLSKDYNITDTQAVIVLLFFVLLMGSLLIAFLMKVTGETIMEYHIAGGKEAIKKYLKEGGYSEADHRTYRSLSTISRWRYAIVQYGPYILGICMGGQWATLLILGIVTFANRPEVTMETAPRPTPAITTVANTACCTCTTRAEPPLIFRLDVVPPAAP